MNEDGRGYYQIQHTRRQLVLTAPAPFWKFCRHIKHLFGKIYKPNIPVNAAAWPAVLLCSDDSQIEEEIYIFNQ